MSSSDKMVCVNCHVPRILDAFVGTRKQLTEGILSLDYLCINQNIIKFQLF